jgi:hypothetical protein
MAGSYDIIVDINITKLNISLNDAAPEEVALCNNSASCCRTNLSFFFWPMCCLSCFDLPILITPLVSSNSSDI